jgi:hypothetical protein
MAYFPWNRFRRWRSTPIRKLRRTPHSSIKRWLREKQKRVTIDPFRNKTKKTTEKEISTKNLRTVVSQVFHKVDELIDYIQRYDETDKVIRAEIDMRIEDVERLEEEHKEDFDYLLERVEWLTRFLYMNFAWDAGYRRYDTNAMAKNVAADRTHRAIPSPPAHYAGVEAGGLLHEGGVVGHGHPHNENGCYCYGDNNGYDMIEKSGSCFDFTNQFVGTICPAGTGEYTPWLDAESKIRAIVKDELGIVTDELKAGGRTKPVPKNKNYRKSLIKKILQKQKDGN